MAQVLQTVDVEVPVTVSYNQWTQFEEFPQFLSFVKEITQQDDTHNHWTVNIAGGERQFDTVITEQLPDERIAWTSTGGEVDHAGVVTFHKLAPTETRVTVQLDWEPTGLFEKLGSAVGVGGHAVKKDLKNFKEYIESEGHPDGAWRGDVEA